MRWIEIFFYNWFQNWNWKKWINSVHTIFKRKGKTNLYFNLNPNLIYNWIEIENGSQHTDTRPDLSFVLQWTKSVENIVLYRFDFKLLSSFLSLSVRSHTFTVLSWFVACVLCACVHFGIWALFIRRLNDTSTYILTLTHWERESDRDADVTEWLTANVSRSAEINVRCLCIGHGVRVCACVSVCSVFVWKWNTLTFAALCLSAHDVKSLRGHNVINTICLFLQLVCALSHWLCIYVFVVSFSTLFNNLL